MGAVCGKCVYNVLLLLLWSNGPRPFNGIGYTRETNRIALDGMKQCVVWGGGQKWIIFSWFGKLFWVNRMWCYVHLIFYVYVCSYVSVWQACYYGDKMIIILCMQSIWSLSHLIIFHFYILQHNYIVSASISINIWNYLAQITE